MEYKIKNQYLQELRILTRELSHLSKLTKCYLALLVVWKIDKNIKVFLIKMNNQLLI